MNDNIDHIELVKKAQLGDKECLNRLAEAGRERLREYVHRLTLREDLTEDIVQESILEMFKVFDKLKRTDRFWSWLDGIAFNKVRSYYGRRWRHKTVSLSDAESEITEPNSPDGLADMIASELKQIVIKSMGRLQPRHRAVLTMRCYKGMKYSEIAKLMECSEFGVQALFYRAKKSLAKELSRSGLARGSLLTALVLFGKMTATSKAAAATISVTAATTKVSLAAGLAGVVGGKTLVVSLTTAGVLAVGTMVATSAIDGTTKMAWKTPAGNLPVMGQVAPAQAGDEECWYYYPQNASGPVMLRVVKWDAQGKKSYCKWWQDDQANYSFEKSRNTLYINNYRMWNSELNVRRLPTDSPQLTDFLSRIEGKSTEMEYVTGRGQGLLVITRRSEEEKSNRLRIIQHYNALDEEYFRYKWPPGAKVEDKRDSMHKRGWTYFKITGQINGKEVLGRGRIPFVYAAGKSHWPWIVLKAGDSIVSQACFAGLSRPWMGLHTIDTVRRDAAEKQIWFETKYNKSSGKVEVVLKPKDRKIMYSIDMEKDVIDSIAFSGDTEGQLQFDYLQNIDDTSNEFVEPSREARLTERSKGMLWLLELIKDN
ncbi:MAG: RNA polymerase sigma factor [Planctomycetes bacterium]|nr:RNA polymerase sigma factor [Planctomycetota bacterium]